MNYIALDIIHFWTDSRKTLIHNVIPSKGKVFVYCKVDLSKDAIKVCNFITLVVKQPWTFQVQRRNEMFEIKFFPETVSLADLFSISNK